VSLFFYFTTNNPLYQQEQYGSRSEQSKPLAERVRTPSKPVTVWSDYAPLLVIIYPCGGALDIF